MSLIKCLWSTQAFIYFVTHRNLSWVPVFQWTWVRCILQCEWYRLSPRHPKTSVHLLFQMPHLVHRSPPCCCIVVFQWFSLVAGLKNNPLLTVITSTIMLCIQKSTLFFLSRAMYSIYSQIPHFRYSDCESFKIDLNIPTPIHVNLDWSVFELAVQTTCCKRWYANLSRNDASTLDMQRYMIIWSTEICEVASDASSYFRSCNLEVIEKMYSKYLMSDTLIRVTRPKNFISVWRIWLLKYHFSTTLAPLKYHFSSLWGHSKMFLEGLRGFFIKSSKSCEYSLITWVVVVPSSVWYVSFNIYCIRLKNWWYQQTSSQHQLLTNWVSIDISREPF